MKIKISYKLALALAASNLAVLAIALVLVERNLTQGFQDYVEGVERDRAELLAERLTETYARWGTWDFLRDRPEDLRDTFGIDLRRPPPRRGHAPPRHKDSRSDRHKPRDGSSRRDRPPRPFDPEAPPVDLERRIMLEDANSRPLLGDPVIRKYGEPFSIQFDSETVAILYVVPPPAMSNATDFAFVRSQQRAIWVIAGSALLIALLVAAALGAWMVRPVKAVAAAAGALAKGDYGVRIQSRRGDELGELARDFDQLAGALESNRRERRHLLADISHELRTPLSVLRGELDAVQDGIRPLNQRTVTALDAEVYRLSSLIDDLNELAQSDIGGMTYCVENASLVALIDQVVSDFAIDCERAQLNVAFDKPEGGKSTISADPARIEQLLRNLMRNSIRYTDGPGRIRIRLYSQDQGFLIDWEDSAPDVPKASLSQLFDRLYRVDTSRSRATGGAGIGLSIVRNVAQAHGGDVSASISSLGGLKISIYLPKIKADV